MIEIPGYRIVRTLGQGGMATVYLAIQESFEREVALKVLSGEQAKDPSFSERFLREAKIVSRLVHPNIVTVYDVGIESGQHFLSMEYIPGADLKQVRAQLSLSERLSTIKDIARALSFSGQKGYVHRDVKPENIMLHADSGRAVLMDFGIARPSEAVSSMTQTGTAIGTPHYMSPEQARGQVVDARSDLYSLGVVMFLMLVGYVPFDADSAVAVGVKHVSEPIPRLPSHLNVFQGIINKILSKDPEHRYQTGDELIADLDELPPYALAEVAAWESAHERSERFVDGSVDSGAETLVGEAVTSAPAQQLDSVGTSALDPPLSGEAPVAYHEEESASLWPWVAAVTLAAGVVFAVYYQQKLPSEYRLPISGGDQSGKMPAGFGAVKSASKGGVGESPLSVAVAPGEGLESGAQAGAGRTDQGQAIESEVDVLATVAKPAAVAGVQITAHQQGDGSIIEVVASGREERLEEAADWVAKGLSDPAMATRLIPQAADRYRQLLGRNPTDIQARQGLRDIRENIQRSARGALEANRFADVERLLALAEATFPKAATEPKFQRLQQRMQKAVDIKKLLELARERMQANALTLPLEDNAAAYFKQVLAIKPGHVLAQQGLTGIAQRYAAHAKTQLSAGNIGKAQESVTQGLGVVAGNTELKAVAARIEKHYSLVAALGKAERLRQQGKVLTPAGGSALDTYRQVLTQQPRQPQALAALDQIEDDLVARIESFISSNDHQQATAEINRALFFFPQSQTLQGLKLINAQAIDDMLEASQPKISKVLVSNQVMVSLVDAQQKMLAVDRIIHVGFYFKNFEAATSVVHAVLFDGARSLQIAQVPVIVSGQEGAQFFRIERPVEGFADGGYSIDLMLEGHRLSSAVFEVGSRVEL